MRHLHLQIPFRHKLLIFLLCSALWGVLPGCSSGAEDVVIVPNPRESVRQGKMLVEGLASCGRCHGAQPHPGSPLTGGLVLEDRYGDVSAPNLASPKLKEWTLTEFVNSLRKHIRPDGSPLATEHHTGFEWLSDDDIYSVAAYIQALPVRENEIEQRDLTILSTWTSGLLESRPIVEGYVPPIAKKHREAYGKYLVDHVARCDSCHNTPESVLNASLYLQGGGEFERNGETTLAPNITSSETVGIGSWSEEDIVRYLKSGKPRGSAFAKNSICPTDFYSRAPLDDLKAIAQYLVTVDMEEAS
jgi:cytochrome c553